VHSSSPAGPFSLVIFDCDGVLVDSEPLGLRVIIDSVREHGLEVTWAEAMTHYRGAKMGEIVEDLSRKLGRALPDDFVPQLRARMAEVFRQELKPIPGVREALEKITLPICVASSGPREKITLTLSLAGLLPRFETRIFSAYEVQSWKPAPDLFLHAATACGAVPSTCAVVEDSLFGIQAGLAAGMKVFAYHPHGDETELQSLGATVFRHMNELPALLQGCHG
jgi:HAD superfamily hydrolase (TIGR01509 family)